MTANAESESKSPSRRALLAGALGGLGAFAASAIGRSSRVRAGVDGDVVLGQDNVAAAPTQIRNVTNGNSVLLTESNSGISVLAHSNSNYAVSGVSGSSIGVYGSSDAANLPGSVGWSRGSATGLLGVSTSGALVAARGQGQDRCLRPRCSGCVRGWRARRVRGGNWHSWPRDRDNRSQCRRVRPQQQLRRHWSRRARSGKPHRSVRV